MAGYTPTFLIHQELDETGTPDPAEFFRSFPPSLRNFGNNNDMFRFLEGLHPTFTPHADIYGYRDATGSGRLELQGFNDSDRRQVARRVELLAIDAAIGMSEPGMRWDGDQARFGMVLPFKNPWINIVLAAALFLFGAVLCMASIVWDRLDPSRGPLLLWLTVFFTACFMVGGIVIAAQHARRVPWWRAARAYVRANGRPMPEDLRLDT